MKETMAGALSDKVKAIYDAVEALMVEGMDLNVIKVSDITGRANIGKGTAYDYFDSKEDIIVSALLYQTREACLHMKRGMEERGSFADKFRFLMECMKVMMENHGCFFKVIHMVMDSSALSRMLREKITAEDGDGCLPEALFRELVDYGMTSGEIGKALPEKYVGLAITSRLVAYVLYQYRRRENSGACLMEDEEMKNLLCESLCAELGVKSGKSENELNTSLTNQN